MRIKFMLLTLISISAFLLAPATVFANGTAVGAVSVNVAAEEPKEPAPFSIITNETDDFQPENDYSITFAENITINAESVKGAKVNVKVTFDETLELESEVYEQVTIGPTQKFIQPVSLMLGDNTIEITVEKDGFETSTFEAVVKRKDVTILESLQKLLVIPSKIK